MKTYIGKAPCGCIMAGRIVRDEIVKLGAGVDYEQAAQSIGEMVLCGLSVSVATQPVYVSGHTCGDAQERAELP